MTDPITKLRTRLQRLEAQQKAGTLGDKDYARTRAALERELLDHVLAAPAVAASLPAAGAAPRPSTRLVASLAAAVLAVAAVGYWRTGAPGVVSGVPATTSAGANSPHETSQEQMNALTAQLAERMQSTPDDADGWAMLARSYAALGRPAEALSAFERLLKLRPDDASVVADYADALAVKNNGLAGEPMKFVERALKLDPKHVKALLLAGTDAFNRNDYAKAVQTWERAIEAGPPDHPLMSMAHAGVAEARKLGQLPDKPAAALAAPAGTGAAPTPAPGSAAAVVAAGAVSGTVSLAPALKGKVAPDDAVFVFARAAEGSRMPLALLRAQVKDLPLTFTLDDSLAMSRETRLSTAGQVVVGARISKSGQAMPQAGDFEGLSEATPVGRTGITVLIGSDRK